MRIIEIIEGRFDPYTNKAIFFAGGAGSGKTFVARKLASVFYGLKQVNPDAPLKHLLKKTNLDIKMPPEEEYFRDRMRQKSKQIVGKQQQTYQKEKLGMLIDTTGRSYSRIIDMKKELEGEGYDTAMVFVKADLATQLRRNKNRPRQVPEKIIKQNYDAIMQNLGRYQRLFGNQMFILDNSESNQGNIDNDLDQLEKNIHRFLISK
jgi:dephospho-CoA kinase